MEELMNFKVTKVVKRPDSNVGYVHVKHGSLVLSCKVISDGDGPYVVKPPYVTIRDYRFHEFIEAVKEAWALAPEIPAGAKV